jgi:2-keto-4-pentenoate hydratase/2-oxohepta-3-ene-1,7-dioic acid hydratase in catechol pathway
MRLAVFSEGGRPAELGLVDGAVVTALLRAGEPADAITMGSVIAAGPAGLAEAASRGKTSSRRFELGGVRLHAPLTRPGKIIAAPVNYARHMQEMSQTLDINDLGVFLKANSSVCGPGDVVRLPYSDRRFDQEGELGVVIGRTSCGVGADEALAAVFGYTCLLDITMRGGEDRSLRKSFDTFTPIGPWFVTADEVGDPGALGLTCSVSGQTRQSASTAALIWPVAKLVAYSSSVMTLYPGDIIATGTPEGVGPLADGDRIEVTIEKIGTLAVTVSAAGATRCPTAGAHRGPVPPPPPPRLRAPGRARPVMTARSSSPTGRS